MCSTDWQCEVQPDALPCRTSFADPHLESAAVEVEMQNGTQQTLCHEEPKDATWRVVSHAWCANLHVWRVMLCTWMYSTAGMARALRRASGHRSWRTFRLSRWALCQWSKCAAASTSAACNCLFATPQTYVYTQELHINKHVIRGGELLLMMPGDS